MDLQAMGGERGLPGPYRQAARRHGGDPVFGDLVAGLAFITIAAIACRIGLGAIPGLAIWSSAWAIAAGCYGMGYLFRRSHDQRRYQEEP